MLKRIVFLSFFVLCTSYLVNAAEDIFLFPAENIGKTKAAWATFSPDGKYIAYVCTQVMKLCVKDVNASDEDATKYPNMQGVNYISWSPDSSQLIVSADISLYLVSLSTREVTTLTTGDLIWYQPSWFPDGKKIICIGQNGWQSEVYSIDVSSKETRKITDTKDMAESSPAVSPDGTQIVFAGERNRKYDLYIKELDSGIVSPTRTHASVVVNPVWGKAGIAYMRTDSETSITDAYLLDPGTGKSVPITKCPMSGCWVMHMEWEDSHLIMIMYGDDLPSLDYSIWKLSFS